MSRTYDEKMIAELSESFEQASPEEIIGWAVAEFAPDLAVSSSFQTHSMTLLDMARKQYPQIPVLFLDTGYHFWETLLFREELEADWGLNIIDLRRDDRWEPFLRRYGRDLPATNPELCCYLRKVQPMQAATASMRAWITGIRRDQTEHRAQAQILEIKGDGLLRIAPLLNWRKEDVEAYHLEHHLPQHPLWDQGYRSIGCKPCTRPVQPGESERAGRWSGTGKTECGLHTELFDQKKLTPEDFG
jgi:phosphoadenosine phosphosulfate reductase